MEEKAHLLTHSLNDEAVYRTAPATPGLLIILQDDMFPIWSHNMNQ